MTEHKTEIFEKMEAGEIVSAREYGANLRLYHSEFNLSDLTVESGDTVDLIKLPEKGLVVAALFGNNVSLGTSTVKIGTATDDDEFRASAVKTSLTPELCLASNTKCAGKTIIMTVGTADLPTSDNVVHFDVLVADL
ncbi:MAG: hypothetical protein MJ250_02815 [Alphaproteobacteria bacterium]|nr:hypothetical protein [Alphaproteobacteria bacterium]